MENEEKFEPQEEPIPNETVKDEMAADTDIEIRKQ